jgi:hypothetical protein
MPLMIAIHRLRPPLRRWQCVSAGAVLLLAAMQADAQTSPRDNAFTVHGGFRDGGSFVDTATDRKVRLDGSGMFAASLDLGLDGTRQLQFHVSQQQSDLQLSSATGASSGTARLPLTVTYLHLGGTNFFDGPIGRGPYVLGGIGATLLRPGSSEYATELRPSINLGLGYQLPLGDRIALRFEARGYFTLVDSSGGLFCDGGCTLSIRGDGFTQGDVQIGVSIRF